MAWPGYENYRPPSLSETETTREKRSKYRNVKTTVDGQTFDSAKEARRYTELKMLEKAGTIRGLRRQVVFDLEANGTLVCRYVADFLYHHGESEIVEDVKGVRTDVYRLKKKLMKACYGIEILET